MEKGHKDHIKKTKNFRTKFGLNKLERRVWNFEKPAEAAEPKKSERDYCPFYGDFNES